MKMKLAILTSVFFGLPFSSRQQSMPMGDVLMISDPGINRDITKSDLQVFLNEEIKPAWKPRVDLHVFKADRGDRKGEYLLVCPIKSQSDRDGLPDGTPFKSGSYTEYRLIGKRKTPSLPEAKIIGLHYLQVKPERAAEFEKFVAERLSPAVSQLSSDLQLLYYKGITGERAGTYLAAFVLNSVAAREKYWPSNAPETDLLRQTFAQLKAVAQELGTFLVDGSYLKPESGAAAFFESKKWTDFVHQ